MQSRQAKKSLFWMSTASPTRERQNVERKEQRCSSTVFNRQNKDNTRNRIFQVLKRTKTQTEITACTDLQFLDSKR